MIISTTRLVVLVLMLFIFPTLVNPSYSISSEKLPALQPHHTIDYDIVKDPQTGKILLRFSGSIENLGDGPLEIVGYRTTVDPNDNQMPAYQRIYYTDSSFRDVLVGTLIYHPEHHHFHFQDAMEYRLLDADRRTIVISQKQSFCLSDVDIVDSSLPHFSKIPIYNKCYHDPYAKFVKMGISIGWEDIYEKRLVGQSIDITNLMYQPQQTYYLQEISNPQSILYEKNSESQEFTIPITLGQGIHFGVGISRPGV